MAIMSLLLNYDYFNYFQSSHEVGLLSERVVLVHVVTAMYDTSENTNFTAAEAYYVAVKLHYLHVPVES